MLHNPTLAPAAIVTRHDAGGKQAGRLQDATPAKFYAVLSEDFCTHTILSVKLTMIFADDQGTFCLVLAFSFTSD